MTFPKKNGLLQVSLVRPIKSPIACRGPFKHLLPVCQFGAIRRFIKVQSCLQAAGVRHRCGRRDRSASWRFASQISPGTQNFVHDFRQFAVSHRGFVPEEVVCDALHRCRRAVESTDYKCGFTNTSHREPKNMFPNLSRAFSFSIRLSVPIASNVVSCFMKSGIKILMIPVATTCPLCV